MKFFTLLVIFFTHLMSSDTYKVELINDPFDPNWVVAVGTIVVGLATLIAGFRYLFVEGTLYKHTELYIDCQKIGELNDKNIIELTMKISNKGRKIMTFYNFHLFVSSIKDQILKNNEKFIALSDEENNMFEVLLQKNMISEVDEYVRLHSDTSYNFNTYFTLDKNIEVIKFELWVLYIKRRVGGFIKGYDMDKLENQEFNSIEKIFYIKN